MKKLMTLTLSVAVVVLLSSSAAWAQGSGAGIVNSPHDFTDNIVAGVTGTMIENSDAVASAWNNKRKEICRTCHVPHDHGAVRYGNLGLLWNHDVSTKTSWTMYTSSSIDGAIDGSPGGTSKMCLGCHDGVSALNNYDGKTAADAGYGGGTTREIDADYDPGFAVGNTTASLTNNHPISIVYDIADTGLKATSSSIGSRTIAQVLQNGKVECSSCHDVHDKVSVSGTHLLRVAQKGADGTGAGASGLCLACHDK